MATPPTPPPADRAGLTDLLNRLPGGKHIAEHVDDGPFWLIPLSAGPDTNWAAEAVLDAYPQWIVPVKDQSFTIDPGVELTAVHAVPQFGREMLEWHNQPDDSDDLNVLVDQILGPFSTLPGTAELVMALPDLLDVELELDIDFHHARAAAITSSGAEAVLTMLTQLDYTGDQAADAALFAAAITSLT